MFLFYSFFTEASSLNYALLDEIARINDYSKTKQNVVDIKNSHFYKFSENVIVNGIISKISDCSFTDSSKQVFINKNFQNIKESRSTYDKETNVIKNTLFDTLISGDFGGAFYSIESKLFFENCLFSDVQAKSGGAGYASSSSIDFSTSNFTQCFATDTAGAFYEKNSTSNLEKCCFLACASESTGGAISSVFSTTNSVSCLFMKCNSQVASAVFAEGLTISFDSTFFIENECSTQKSPSVRGYRTNITLKNCVFANNTANKDLVSVEVSKGFALIENSCFDTENATFSGPNYIVIKSTSCVMATIDTPSMKEHDFLLIDCFTVFDIYEFIGYSGLIFFFSLLAYILLPPIKKDRKYTQAETINA